MSGPYVYHRPVDNSALVRRRDRSFLRELIVPVAAVAALGAGLLALAWAHVETLRTGYRVEELEKELHQLREAERQLRLKVAVGTHPRELEARARTELGMQPLSLDQTLFYEQVVTAAAEDEPAPVGSGTKGRTR